MRREFKLECADGKQLYARVFEAESPRGVLCVAHGLGEHGDRYQKFADFMNAHGMTVYAQDHRGHGRNVEKKSQRGIARMADLERDMVAMIDFAAKETGLPVIQFGHSLGGLIGLYTTMHSKPLVCAAIITSPWLKLVSAPPQAAFKAIGALSGVLSPFSINNGIPSTALCHDPAVCAAYDVDPQNHGRIGLALAADANRAANWVLAHPEELKVPLLLCHGEQDPICSVEGSREFAEKAKGVRFVEFEGAYHELHNEPLAAEKLFETELEFIDEILSLKA